MRHQRLPPTKSRRRRAQIGSWYLGRPFGVLPWAKRILTSYSRGPLCLFHIHICTYKVYFINSQEEINVIEFLIAIILINRSQPKFQIRVRRDTCLNSLMHPTYLVKKNIKKMSAKNLYHSKPQALLICYLVQSILLLNVRQTQHHRVKTCYPLTISAVALGVSAVTTSIHNSQTFYHSSSTFVVLHNYSR